MLDSYICTSHADGRKDVLETRDQPPFYAWEGELTWGFYESTGFIMRTLLASRSSSLLSAAQREGNNLEGFKDFCLKMAQAKARIWP